MKTMLWIWIVMASIFTTTNLSLAQWAQTNGPYGGAVYAFAVSGPNLFAGTTHGGVFLSTNNGTSWTAVNTGLTDTWIYALAISPAIDGTGRGLDSSSGTNLFAGTDDGVFLSTNNGTSWTAVSTGLTKTYVRALVVSPNGAGGMNLFAGTVDGGGVFLSTNYGTSWTAVNTGLTNNYVRALIVSPDGAGRGLDSSSGTNLYAGTEDGIFLSTNSGTSWTAVNTGLTKTYVQALAVSPNGAGRGFDSSSGTNLFAAAGGGVFLSTNNGTSWTAVDTGLTNTYVTCLVVSGTNIFAGTGGGVFLSTNNGTSWVAASAGLADTYVNALTVSPNGTGGTNLFAGTEGGGVWRRPLREMTGVAEQKIEVPSRFALQQNYPNPFNPRTVISYQLPVNSYVTLKVYDVLGREVAMLVNEKKDAGRYSVQWDATKMSSGIYFYKLEAASNGKVFSQTKKSLLMK